MKASYKAALLSAFVFPGVGHFYFKKYWRGLLIMVVALSDLVFMVWSATSSALNLIDSAIDRMQGGATGFHEISNVIGSKALTAAAYYDAVFWCMVFVWIFAIIDAYRIGKQRESQDKDNSPIIIPDHPI